MRSKIRAEKTENGYVMIAIGGGKKEYPQEGYVHSSKKSVYEDARHMYASQPVWDWNEKDKTIKID